MYHECAQNVLRIAAVNFVGDILLFLGKVCSVFTWPRLYTSLVACLSRVNHTSCAARLSKKDLHTEMVPDENRDNDLPWRNAFRHLTMRIMQPWLIPR